MGARIPMSSGAGHGRRIREEDVAKSLQMIGRPKLVATPTMTDRGRQNRRTTLSGGGSSFVQAAYQRHPFATGFGGTLIALKLIHGETVRQG